MTEEMQKIPVYYENVEGVRDLKAPVRSLLERIKWEELIGKKDRVLIKPNFCADYKEGVTTHMALIKAVVNLAEDRAGEVIVGETESSFKDYRAIMEHFPLDCKILNLTKEETLVHRDLNLPKIASDTIVINLPMFKTHTLTGMTLGIKNLFGFVQDKRKSRYHYRIDRVLLDILEAIRPPINIMDGIYCMEGNGPTDGRIRRSGFLLASRDVIALDMAACKVACADLSQVKHVQMASEKYKIKPDFSEDVRMCLEIPKTRLNRVGAYLQHNPVTGRLLENPNVHSFAKKVRNTLDGKKLK